VKYFEVFDDAVVAVLAGLLAVSGVAPWGEVRPGGGAGGAARGVFVCAIAGKAIRAVAAIILPIEVCLAMIKCLPLGQGSKRSAYQCGSGRFGHKRTCGLDRLAHIAVLPQI
jgi:hypothetical protein